MKILITTLCLVFCVAMSAQSRETLTVNSNDSTAVAGLEFPFIAKMTNAPAGAKLLYYSSDTTVAKIKNKSSNNGTENFIIIQDFGVSNVTVKIAGSGGIKKSIKVSVVDTSKTNLNELAHGSIYSKEGKTQFLTLFEDASGKIQLNSPNNHLTIKTSNLVKTSESVEIAWDAMSKEKGFDPNDALQFYKSNEDSTNVYLKTPGTHTIILTASNALRTDTIASYQINIIGDTLKDYTYIPILDQVTHNEKGFLKKFTSTPPDYIIGDYYYEKGGELLIKDKYDNKWHKAYQIHGKFGWKEGVDFTDTREYYSNSSYPNINPNYKIRRFADGKIWMDETLNYVPKNPPNLYTTDQNGSASSPMYFYKNGRVAYNAWALYGNNVRNSMLQIPTGDPFPTPQVFQGPCPDGWRMVASSDYLVLGNTIRDQDKRFKDNDNNIVPGTKNDDGYWNVPIRTPHRLFPDYVPNFMNLRDHNQGLTITNNNGTAEISLALADPYHPALSGVANNFFFPVFGQGVGYSYTEPRYFNIATTCILKE